MNENAYRTCKQLNTTNTNPKRNGEVTEEEPNQTNKTTTTIARHISVPQNNRRTSIPNMQKLKFKVCVYETDHENMNARWLFRIRRAFISFLSIVIACPMIILWLSHMTDCCCLNLYYL